MDIKVDGAKLVIDNTEIELSEYSGQKVTVFQEDDGSLTVESKPTHQLAICELQVPAPVIASEDTGETDSEGMAVMREMVQPLDLSGVEIHEFALGGA